MVSQVVFSISTDPEPFWSVWEGVGRLVQNGLARWFVVVAVVGMVILAAAVILAKR